MEFPSTIENSQEGNTALVQEVFDLVQNSLKELNQFNTANGNERIHGEIVGRLDTTPTTPFEITFDTTVSEFEKILIDKIKESIGSISDAHVVTLNRSIKLIREDGEVFGGYKSLISK